MLIASKTKDFYDFMVGKWGIDRKVVYNRGNNKLIDSKYYKACVGMNEYKSYWLFERIPQKDRHGNWIRKTFHYLNEPKCLAILWTGDTYYVREVILYYDNNGVLCSEWQPFSGKQKWLFGISNVELHLKRNSDAPVYFEICGYDSHCCESTILENPILDGSKFVSFLNPEQVYLDIYSYISRRNEKEITDNRTNDEKIVCNGFDRKASFRNVK
jgi:hypothetical protein